MNDRVGQQFGNYRLVSLLGQGGYAEVYLGQHVRLSLQAAIKVLHAYLSGSEAEHFYQEAQTIAKLTHPSIVRVFDYDVQESVPFLVMDYAPNGSLRRRYPKGSVVPLPQIVSSVKQVAAALQYAHEQKFIHRDVKPENMLVGRREEVLLSDFGIATVAHNTDSLSASGQGTVGTIAYMAPEQIEGHPRVASDQYALGVVVYEWLCGERPFEGSVTEIIVKHLSMPPPPLRERLPTISPEIEQVVLRALVKDSKERFASVQEFAQALEQASQHAPVALASKQAGVPTEVIPSADVPAGAFDPTVFPGSSPPTEIDTPQSRDVPQTPQPGHFVAHTAAVMPSPLEPTMPVQRKTRRLSGSRTALLLGLVVVIIAAGVLGSTSLLAHFGVLGTRTNATTPTGVRGGTWTEDLPELWGFLIPNDSFLTTSALIDQALYLPLFYGDAQGVVHPGAATEVPSLQNGGISADFKTWTFHLRPGLVWSDGQPYDARDVDYTWRLWLNPKFAGGSTPGLNLITSTDVSADHLTITFHFKQASVSFLSLWVDGFMAPLSAHHFSAIAPETIENSPERFHPTVTSGPFMVAESLRGDHLTLVRNPRYYRASAGLPYLDKLVFRTVDQDTILRDLQAGTIDSAWFLDVSKVPAYERLSHYSLVTPPTSTSFEAFYFNFHNPVLASHLEVRQAIAMAIDHQALISVARRGFASPLCTDHSSVYQLGYQPDAPCPVFDPAVANKLLSDNGWLKGPDGVRSRGGQRLEFEYSTTANISWRSDDELIIQRNLAAIGIKLDIQNYSEFWPWLGTANASPPTGAVAGRYDIAEWENNLGYDPDDSSLLSCGLPGYYCNPALDALYKQEQTTADPEARQLIFGAIHHIYLTDFPFIVLYALPDLSIVRKGTHNYQPSPFSGVTNVWQWWCDHGKC